MSSSATNTFTKRPSPEDKVAYGQYLTRSALCSDCHTPIDARGTPLPGFPEDLVVEVPATVDRIGAHPIPQPPLPVRGQDEFQGRAGFRQAQRSRAGFRKADG